MAVRTTSVAVGGIIEVDSNISLTPFIEVANALVTECCSTDDYDATRLELIERWLSAHFYAIRDPRTTQESVGRGIAERFQSQVDLGFDVTHYGQMAMRLDTQGGLSSLNERIKNGGGSTAGVSWLGTPTDEIQDIVDELG